MRLCGKCHDGMPCENEHPRVTLRAPGAGPECGLCGGDVTEVECYSPVAREIDSFNMAARRFLLRMRAKFVENIDKGGWAEIDWGYALKRLNHEVGELAEHLTVPIKGPVDWDAIIDEAADVSNFSLFLATRASTEIARNDGIAKLADEAMAKFKAKKEGVTS